MVHESNLPKSQSQHDFKLLDTVITPKRENFSRLENRMHNQPAKGIFGQA